MDHIVDGPDGTVVGLRHQRADLARMTRQLPSSRPGRRLKVDKLLAYGWSSSRSLPACATRSTPRWRRRSAPAGTGSDTTSASTSTTSGTAPTSRSRATASSAGGPLRALPVLQAGARAERRAIPAKGLTGPGYDGHTFWDTESFVLPLLTLHRTARRGRRAAAGATRRSTSRGSEPSSSAWRVRRSRGGRSAAQECSGYWPAGTAAFHINADIADAVLRYMPPPATRSSARGPGSSCWSRPPGSGARSGTTTPTGVLPHRRSDRARRVLGARRRQRLHEPDGGAEPARAADLRRAASARGRRARRRRARRSRAWRDAADRDARALRRRARRPPAGRGLHRATARGTSSDRPEEYPLLLHVPVLPALPQAGGQAGRPRVRAATPRRPLHPRARRRATSPTTRRITVRDSSLSACVQAVVAAEVGHLELAYDYFGEAALHGPRRPRAQHARRPAHRLAGGRLARGGGRLRWRAA